MDVTIIPCCRQEILEEYDEVLHGTTFHLRGETIEYLRNALVQFGVEVFLQPLDEILINIDHLVFYEVVLRKRENDAYLVTNNQELYPTGDYIASPNEMLNIIEQNQII